MSYDLDISIPLETARMIDSSTWTIDTPQGTSLHVFLAAQHPEIGRDVLRSDAMSSFRHLADLDESIQPAIFQQGSERRFFGGYLDLSFSVAILRRRPVMMPDAAAAAGIAMASMQIQSLKDGDEIFRPTVFPEALAASLDAARSAP